MSINHFKNILYTCVLASILLSCAPSGVTEDGLKEYISNEAHGLHKRVVKNNNDIEVFYRPAALVWKHDLEAIKDVQQRAQIQKQYDTLSYFVFHIARNGKEIENSFVSNPSQFSAVISYLSFDISNTIFLVQDRDTTRALDAIYTRAFGGANSTSVMAVFAKNIKEQDGNVKVYLDDTLLGIGLCEFIFQISAIKDTPTLKLD